MDRPEPGSAEAKRIDDTRAAEKQRKEHTFREELTSLLNRNSRENGSGTPDFILANFMLDSLTAFNAATNRREAWYGREQDPRFGTPAKGFEHDEQQI